MNVHVYIWYKILLCNNILLEKDGYIINPPGGYLTIWIDSFSLHEFIRRWII
jgi:hypothetical protein